MTSREVLHSKRNVWCIKIVLKRNCNMPQLKTVTFTVHNEEHTVSPGDIAPETTLLQYLREHENLRGTKYMCLEGGCGACIVAAIAKHPLTQRTVTFAVNSCLVSIYSCQGWDIHTVEGIGNKKRGYHPVQKVLAEFNGTQCGYCSPGMVMNMYPYYESNNLKMKVIERAFGGNICRCTGYRPILTAFKSLAEDANAAILGEYPDIEDLKECAKNRETCQRKCKSICRKNSVSMNYFTTSKSKWFKVFSINEIFDVFRDNPESVYIPKSNPDIYIDVSSVTNLVNDAVTSEGLIVGANKTLHDTIILFEKIAKNTPKFSYLNALAQHIEQVAQVPVRNIASLAGNLSIKHQHNDFPSDIFLILETVGATLKIMASKTKEIQRSILEFLSYDMNRKVIKNICLPKLDDSYNYRSYKITPRAQNAHAIVNAGFLLKLDKNRNVQSARLVYGGINPTFVHATRTEQYLTGKKLFDDNTLQGAFSILDREIQPNNALPQTSPEFRKKLAIALFYKFILSIAPDKILSPENKSGGSLLSRPISTGVQDFQTNESLYPLTEPIPKLEALGQTSGEVEYIIDMPNSPDQLFACFVTAKAPANSIVKKIDPSEALKMDGVVAFFEKDDIPGDNTFIPLDSNYPVGFIPPMLHIVPEELFCSGVVKYYFQPLGVVVARTQEIAEKAADMVNVKYSPGKNKPLLTIRQILQAGATNRIINEASLTPKRRGSDTKHVIKGTFDTSWQYHYHMETQTCVVIPKEGELDIYPATQWKDIIQTAVAKVLSIPENKINISVRRLGGAFGGKITRNSLISCATALAAYKLQKPVRMRMTYSENMDVIGKRFPSAANYEVGFNENGEIQYLNTIFYLDYATGGNEPIISLAISIFYASYKHDTWSVSGNNTRTDNHAGVWVRAPGNTTILAMIESIMDHIAMMLNKDPLDLRIMNMDPTKHKKLLGFISKVRQWADYDNRKKDIQNFNKQNRWIKKGLAVVPMTFNLIYAGGLSSMVTIYAGDGTVAVTHAGIEMGQGINTKVAQVCAFTLGIPLNMVCVKASTNITSPNNFTTGGSLTSEAVCYATMRACETLLNRMKPVKDKMKNPTWPELVKKSQEEYVELLATHMFSPNDPVQGYDIYGVCATEVELDILTGQHQVTRVDLLEDTGNSISPFIDIGQVEGAFIMGLGYWTTEQTVYDDEGRLLTDRTWNYKPPGALDIPIDFRVMFPKNNPNSKGILHSKATAEPPLCLSCSIPLAIRQAVASARKASDPAASGWYPFNGPSTVENTFLNSLNDYRQYKL